MTKAENKKTRSDLSKIICEELEFTNGWRVSDDAYLELSDKAAKRIMSVLRRRKIISL